MNFTGFGISAMALSFMAACTYGLTPGVNNLDFWDRCERCYENANAISDCKKLLKAMDDVMVRNNTTFFHSGGKSESEMLELLEGATREAKRRLETFYKLMSRVRPGCKSIECQAFHSHFTTTGIHLGAELASSMDSFEFEMLYMSKKILSYFEKAAASKSAAGSRELLLSPQELDSAPGSVRRVVRPGQIIPALKCITVKGRWHNADTILFYPAQKFNPKFEHMVNALGKTSSSNYLKLTLPFDEAVNRKFKAICWSRILEKNRTIGADFRLHKTQIGPACSDRPIPHGPELPQFFKLDG